MFKRIALAALLTVSFSQAACDGGGDFMVSPGQLKPGGAYIAYVNGCKKGCDKLGRGDLIQEVDGKKITTGADLDAANITDGQPHKLKVLKTKTTAPVEIELAAEPGELEPLKGIPPFWTTGAEELNRAPEYARRRLFGHASPSIALVNSDGGFVTGRTLYGSKHFIVLFDWATQTHQADAGVFLQVLHQAQPFLKDKKIDIMFSQLSFPGFNRPAMNDTDLRAFHDNTVTKKELPSVPLYRAPNVKEGGENRFVGLEGSFRVNEAMGETPVILIMDERGIIRWHSAGLTKAPSDSKLNDQLYTIDSAVQFALNKL